MLKMLFAPVPVTSRISVHLIKSQAIFVTTDDILLHTSKANHHQSEEL
jgi:hypothetical protein